MDADQQLKVDALYPELTSKVAKYMPEVMRVLSALSREDIKHHSGPPPIQDDTRVGDVVRDDEAVEDGAVLLAMPVTKADLIWDLARQLHGRESLTFSEVEAWARAKDATLMADAFNGQAVRVRHQDRSSFFFENAFAVRLGRFRVVFTEHHRFHVYSDDDVKLDTYLKGGVPVTIDWTEARKEG